MSDTPDSQPQRRIDADVKGRFVAALRNGARLTDAAAEVGFSIMGLYGARNRDPAFAAAWIEALKSSAAAERRALAYEARGRGEVRIAAANHRVYQRRRRRNVRFDEAAQDVFLAHFAADCDTKAAAAAAGVHHATVHYHCRTDPAFAEAYAEALARGYCALEDEVLRCRLAAQERLRAAIEAAPPAARAVLRREQGKEFDRAMALLARHDRKPRRAERSFRPGGQRQPWTFERAMQALDKKMRALGLRTDTPPPEE